MVVVFAVAFAVLLATIYRMATETLRDVDLVQSKKQAVVRKGQLCVREAEASEARIVVIEARIAQRQKEFKELKRDVNALSEEVQQQEARQQGRNPTRHKLPTV